MYSITTERLRFRPWTDGDFPTLRNHFAHDDEHTRFIGGTRDPEQTWRLIATYIGHYELRGFSYVAVEEVASGDLVGSVGLWDSALWPEPELGYWLLRTKQGMGFGLEAATAALAFALDEIGFPTLVSFIHPDNHGSERLALKLGATTDGVVDLLSYGPHRVFRYK